MSIDSTEVFNRIDSEIHSYVSDDFTVSANRIPLYVLGHPSIGMKTYATLQKDYSSFRKVNNEFSVYIAIMYQFFENMLRKTASSNELSRYMYHIRRAANISPGMI